MRSTLLSAALLLLTAPTARGQTIERAEIDAELGVDLDRLGREPCEDPCASIEAALAAARADLAAAQAAEAAARVDADAAQDAVDAAIEDYEAAMRRYERARNELMNRVGRETDPAHVSAGTNYAGLPNLQGFGPPGTDFELIIYFDDVGLDQLDALMDTLGWQWDLERFERDAKAAHAADQALQAALDARAAANLTLAAATAAREAAEARVADLERALARCRAEHPPCPEPEPKPEPEPQPEPEPEPLPQPEPRPEPEKPACEDGATRTALDRLEFGETNRVRGLTSPRLATFRTARGVETPRAELPGVAGYCAQGDVLTTRLAQWATAANFVPDTGAIVDFDVARHLGALQRVGGDQLHADLAAAGYDADRHARYVYWMEFEHDGAWERQFRIDRKTVDTELCERGVWVPHTHDVTYVLDELGCQPVTVDNPIREPVEAFGTIADLAHDAMDRIVLREDWVVGPCDGCP